jgi:hypothetical protein
MVHIQSITYFVEVLIPELWWQIRWNSVVKVVVLSTGRKGEMMVSSLKLA